jgi:hypothetical protein
VPLVLFGVKNNLCHLRNLWFHHFVQTNPFKDISDNYGQNQLNLRPNWYQIRPKQTGRLCPVIPAPSRDPGRLCWTIKKRNEAKSFYKICAICEICGFKKRNEANLETQWRSRPIGIDIFLIFMENGNYKTKPIF